MTHPITIVDRGRGLQLSTSRITVQDLVPYFQDNCADDEIIRWIPVLTAEEIAVVRQYYLDHRAAARRAGPPSGSGREAVRLQRLRFPNRKGPWKSVSSLARRSSINGCKQPLQRMKGQCHDIDKRTCR